MSPPWLAMIGDADPRERPDDLRRFMELALYEPTLGYYATGSARAGPAADFLTAPESHPIFGWAIAAQLEEVWDRLGRPGRFVIREFVAGTGALASGILEGLARSDLRSGRRSGIGSPSAHRTASGRSRDRLAAVRAAEALEDDRGVPIDGAIVANEVLDALPVHRVVGGSDEGAILEICSSASMRAAG